MLVRSILQWLAILHSTQRMASENITNQCRMLVIDYITLSAKYGQVTNITNQCRMLVRSILQWLAILHSTQSMASANITNQCRIFKKSQNPQKLVLFSNNITNQCRMLAYRVYTSILHQLVILQKRAKNSNITNQCRMLVNRVCASILQWLAIFGRRPVDFYIDWLYYENIFLI